MRGGALRGLSNEEQPVWHRERSEEGATLVEYAVVAPFLFLLLFGIVEFAVLTSSFTGVWTSAREGARYATTVGDSAITPDTPRFLDCAGIRQAARGLVGIGEPTNEEISITYRDPLGTAVADCDDSDSTLPAPTAVLIGSGSVIEVTVTKSYEAIVPFVGRFLDGITLDSTQSRSVYQGILGAS
ncbi:MAG TPA: TadE family protein [Acidimicrobiia bacterium]|nr:TadE family protein [Acidimicrobiia bacterium]